MGWEKGVEDAFRGCRAELSGVDDGFGQVKLGARSVCVDRTLQVGRCGVSRGDCFGSTWTDPRNLGDH